jgi:hypothetical protein
MILFFLQRERRLVARHLPQRSIAPALGVIAATEGGAGRPCAHIPAWSGDRRRPLEGDGQSEGLVEGVVAYGLPAIRQRSLGPTRVGKLSSLGLCFSVECHTSPQGSAGIDAALPADETGL